MIELPTRGSWTAWREEMRIAGWWVSVALLLALSSSGSAADATAPLVVVFHQEGCPDCAFMQTILDELAADHPDLSIAYHEVSAPGSSELLVLLSQRYGVTPAAVPIIFVGDGPPIVGAGRAQELALREAVGVCLSASCPSPMARAVGLAVPWRELLIAGALVLSLLLLYVLLQKT
jgi:glutaredoxin